MPFLVNHIHLKSKDPKKTADWFVEAFNVQIMSDTVRDFGDRFIVTQTEGGLAINISNERTGENPRPRRRQRPLRPRTLRFRHRRHRSRLRSSRRHGRRDPRRPHPLTRRTQNRLHRRTWRYPDRVDSAGQLNQLKSQKTSPGYRERFFFASLENTTGIRREFY